MALVVARKDGQSLYIGEDIKITFRKNKRNNNSLMVIDAPNYRIIREEQINFDNIFCENCKRKLSLDDVVIKRVIPSLVYFCVKCGENGVCKEGHLDEQL